MANIIRPSMPSRPNAALGPNPANRGGRGGPDFGGSPAAWGASLSGLTVGNVYNLDTQALQPGFRTPYWIDEIRFSMTATYLNPAVNLGTQYTGLAGLLEAKFTTGQYAFSRDFVPLGLHAPRWSVADAGVWLVDNADPAVPQRAFSSVRWPLPKPLFMPAGDAVQALIRFRQYPCLVSPLAPLVIERVNVAYVGRVAAPGTRAPVVRYVPWLASFRKQGSVSGIAQTNDEFRNPFADKSLYVQRFTSRTFRETLYVNGVDDDAFIETFFHQGPIGTGPRAGQQYATVQMYDTLGYVIVKDYPPVNDVFDGTRGAWTFSRTLAPREQFDVQLQTKGTSMPANTDFWTMVGMVGFREES